MKGPALAVMARAPIPGRVKTRLQHDLTPEQCAALSLAFLRDAVALAVGLPLYTPFLAYTPGNARKLFREITPERMQIIPQTSGSLGERMHQLIVALEIRGYSPVVLIGTDIPTLQPDTLLQAARELENADLCFGPSRDGGYYLVGMNRSDERIFQNIEWSTSSVLSQTMRNAKAAGLSVALLEEYSDIDTFNDLKKLTASIGRTYQPPGNVPPHTAGWLRQNRNIFR
ncbi:MAG: TIGR04282 family arsenosugar biosynthesis glycosyltransferase [Dehalococcoidales bacterium]|nr:TIGR04282 family arsenosugar biosynthesis glycosyltransferase [Dehalococcoidales bacterium]